MKAYANQFALAGAVMIAFGAPAFAHEISAPIPATNGTDKAVVAQQMSYNGYSCDMVRAKVAEAGVVGAYAYARYMGLSHRDISRVRKACSV